MATLYFVVLVIVKMEAMDMENKVIIFLDIKSIRLKYTHQTVIKVVMTMLNLLLNRLKLSLAFCSLSDSLVSGWYTDTRASAHMTPDPF